MDWNGILGIVIALGIISLVFQGTQILMDYFTVGRATPPKLDRRRKKTWQSR